MLIIIGAIISLISVFVMLSATDFLTATLATTVGFILIAIGASILRTRLGMWVRR